MLFEALVDPHNAEDILLRSLSTGLFVHAVPPRRLFDAVRPRGNAARQAAAAANHDVVGAFAGGSQGKETPHGLVLREEWRSRHARWRLPENSGEQIRCATKSVGGFINLVACPDAGSRRSVPSCIRTSMGASSDEEESAGGDLLTTRWRPSRVPVGTVEYALGLRAQSELRITRRGGVHGGEVSLPQQLNPVVEQVSTVAILMCGYASRALPRRSSHTHSREYVATFHISCPSVVR